MASAGTGRSENTSKTNGSVSAGTGRTENNNTGTFKTSDGSAGYQPNNIDGKKLTKTGTTVAQTGMKGSVNTAGKSMDNQNIWTDGVYNYVWVGNGNNGGYYALVDKSTGSINFKDVDLKQTNAMNFKYSNNGVGELYDFSANSGMNNKNNNSTNSGSGSGGTPSSGYDPYSTVINNLINEINSLKKPELPAYEDMMRDYGFNIDPQYYIDMWNNQTNEYYDNIIAEQQKQRNQIAAASDLYQNQLRDDYLESYANSANTVANKQARAASMLSQDIQNDYNDAYNDYGMMQSIYDLEEGRKAELARNPLEAEQFLNDLRIFAQQGGVAKTNAELQAYMGNNTALGTRYAAERNTQAAYANAAATKYSGLAQAAGSNYSANNELNTLYNLYTKMYNNDTNAASKAITSNVYTSSGLKYGNTPANRYATTGSV